MTHYVYILLCGDGTLYTGYTNRLIKRFIAHNSGKGAKYTRGRLPVDLLYWELYPTKSLAMKREYEIKQWKLKKKLELIYGVRIINEPKRNTGGN